MVVWDLLAIVALNMVGIWLINAKLVGLMYTQNVDIEMSKCYEQKLYVPVFLSPIPHKYAKNLLHTIVPNKLLWRGNILI